MNYLFSECKLSDIRTLIEEQHYSHSVNGLKISYCFSLTDYDGKIVGGIIFGQLSTTAWKKYGNQESDVLELRRLVCDPSCPSNTESWFIARSIKKIKQNKKHRVIVSYADPYHGHVGYVYQASNWFYVGKTNSDKMFKHPSGKLYHSRALRTKYNGQFKPFVVALRNLHSEGMLQEIVVPGKHVYLYPLTGHQRNLIQKLQKPYPKCDTIHP